MTTDVGDIKESPKSLGLKDGAVIAFAIIEGKGKSTHSEFKVEWSSYEAEYGAEGEGEEAEEERMVEDDE